MTLLITVVGIGVVVYLLFSDKKDKKNKKGSGGSKKATKNTAPKKYTQDLIEKDFKEIKVLSKENPIGLIEIQKNKRYVGILEVQGINLQLLSELEIMDVENSYISMLNGLDFNVQQHIQSKKLDIEDYYKDYESYIEEIERKIESAKDEESKKKLTDRLNYGKQLLEYIKVRCSGSNMIEKRYYFAISTIHNPKEFSEKLSEKEILNNAFINIVNKASALSSTLSAYNMDNRLLTGIEVAGVLQRAYNKKEANHLKAEKAIESGYKAVFVQHEIPEDLQQALYEREQQKEKVVRAFDQYQKKYESEEESPVSSEEETISEEQPVTAGAFERW